MKKLVLVVLFIISIKVCAQLENINTDTLYIHESYALVEIDSIDSINLYPRGEADNYIWYKEYNLLNTQKLKINRVTEKRLKRYILDTVQLPVIKILYDSAISDTSFKKKLENQIKNNLWSVYKKNDNIWMFNIDEGKDTIYTMNNIWKLDSLGGKLWNFDLFGVVAYSRMDSIVNGYTIRQICNSMDGIFKRKSNNQISVHLKRKNGKYPNWNEIKLLDDNYFTIATLSDFRDYYVLYEICKVDNVDESVTGCTPITGYP